MNAAEAAELLRGTPAIRDRAAALLARARAGQSEAFRINDEALAPAARLVAEVTRQRYPDLRIPYHSRWRHFEAGGLDRRPGLEQRLAALPPAQRARSRVDLAVVSVLLDAGAGPRWRFQESQTGQTHSRSEGLGLASFHAFLDGLFSSDPDQPLQADARGLQALDDDRLARAFQVGPDNPLVGLQGRADLMRRLGACLQAQPEVFGPDGRPGGLLDNLMAGATPGPSGAKPGIEAGAILHLLLRALAPIWPASNPLGGIPLGDCWRHEAVRGPGASDGWMPLHKLSQWMSYSLLEPLQWSGLKVRGLDTLTGLAEYRNGGLLIDAGVLQLRDPQLARREWTPADPLVVEWRALTVALLDELAPRVRAELQQTPAQMPLACVLEGGTWAAGRVLAQRARGGDPPLTIRSDGTVF
ncbi:MAG: DUF1688 family protein [Rhodoferax sp.]|nr:DUF1688 family protein [Rhodoferax sp.]